MKYTYAELAKMIDHALLHPSMTTQEMRDGCEMAARYQIASVCIKPYAIRLSSDILKDTGVAVGTVIGFPHGGQATEVKAFETTIACRDGAVEVDMVANLGAAVEGDWKTVERDIRAVVEEAHRHSALVKVIFETGYLTDDVKIGLCKAAESAGADFVKTSTGFGFVKSPDGTFAATGATEADLKLMRANVSPQVQVKAAGGVRTLDALIAARDLGVTRCGTSSTKQILDDYRTREASGETSTASGKLEGGY